MTDWRDSEIACLSGPISGLPDGNRDAFNEAEQKLLTDGHSLVHNPRRQPESDACAQEALDLAERYREGPLYRMLMRRCIAHIMASGVLYVLPGWQSSNGACSEVLVAQVIGVPVVDYATDLPILERVLPCHTSPLA